MTDIKLEIRRVDAEKYKDKEEQYIDMLYPDRQEKVRKLVHAKSRYVSMEAGFLLQDTAAAELGIKPADIRIIRGENGKPTLEGHPDFYFNISHSGEYVVMAYGSVPVGVDVEQLRDKEKRVAKRCFTEEEFSYISQTDDKCGERFLEIWTMKESYLKLTGQGISVPLNSFRVNPVELSGYDKDGKDSWKKLPVQFEFVDLDGYALCVCVDEKTRRDMI
jgi:4'-phosphopantetheinyl transferase